MLGFLKPRTSQTGWTLFQWLFLIAAFLAAMVTFVAVSELDPIEPVSRDVQAMIIANTVIISILALIIVQRYRASRTLDQNQRQREGLSAFPDIPPTSATLAVGVTVRIAV